MYLCHMKLPLMLIFALLYCHPCLAQDSTRTKKLENYQSVADKLIDKYQRTKTDTNYVSRPAQPWTLRLRTDNYGNVLNIDGVDETGAPIKTQMDGGLKSTVGATVNYRGLSLSFSFNPKKLFKKTTNTEYNINYYYHKYGADLSYSDINDVNAKVFKGGITRTLHMSDTHFRSLSGNAYYVFNGRRFSYPSAFTHSWIQKRSAGSFLACANFYLGRMTSDYNDQTTYLARHKTIDIAHINIGGGYAYNYVPNNHWLLHISALPSFIVWKNCKLQIYNDPSTQETITNKLSYHFPELTMLGRLGITYSWSHYFVGVTSVVRTTTVGKHTDFTLTNTLWKARAYLGIRL